MAFLSIPLLLVITQTTSSKLLQPATDLDKELRELTPQEQGLQNFINFIPFLVASFSITVPAGLSLYWIASNVVTTTITLALKAGVKVEDLPSQVQEIMSSIEKNETPDVNKLLGEIPADVDNLVDAARAGSLNATLTLLADGLDPNEKDKDGVPAMHYAAGAGYVPVMSALIKARAELDMGDKKGYTALHYAAGYGQKFAVLGLLDAGAQVTLTSFGKSPADNARGNPRNSLTNETAIMSRLEFRDQFPDLPTR